MYSRIILLSRYLLGYYYIIFFKFFFSPVVLLVLHVLVQQYALLVKLNITLLKKILIVFLKVLVFRQMTLIVILIANNSGIIFVMIAVKAFIKFQKCQFNCIYFVWVKVNASLNIVEKFKAIYVYLSVFLTIMRILELFVFLVKFYYVF